MVLILPQAMFQKIEIVFSHAQSNPTVYECLKREDESFEKFYGSLLMNCKSESIMGLSGYFYYAKQLASTIELKIGLVLSNKMQEF